MIKMSIGSIIADVIISLGTLTALIIGIFNLRDWFDNSYPWIDITIKHHQDNWWEFDIINTGKTTAYDVYIFTKLGWGNDPERIHIEDIKPQQSILRNVSFPPAKKGGVYRIEILTRCNRKFFFKRYTVDEQKKSIDDFGTKPLYTYEPKVKVVKRDNK